MGLENLFDRICLKCDNQSDETDFSERLKNMPFKSGEAGYAPGSDAVPSPAAASTTAIGAAAASKKATAAEVAQ